MDKNFLQDIVPPAGKKTIRNIPIPSHRGSKKVIKESVSPVETNNDINLTINKREESREDSFKETRANEFESDMTDTNDLNNDFEYNPPKKSRRNGGSGGGKKKYIISGLALIVILFVVLSNVFASYKLIIDPKNEPVTVNTEIIAFNSLNPENVAENSLTYKVVEYSDEEKTTVTATGEEEVNEKASGMITVYNNYSERDQKLIANTRFESEDGNIYRIQDSITVPGKNGTTPGSISVEVFADDTGDDYNIESAKFTIPGFKGQDQFDYFYAETKTSISGGFSGIRKVVSKTDLDQASQNLKDSLKQKLLAKIDAEVSDNFVSISNESLINFENIEQKDISGDKIELTLKGDIKSAIFNLESFSNKIADQTLSVFEPTQRVAIEDINSLQIDLGPESNIENSLDLIVRGDANIVWQTDYEKLATDLAGASEKDLSNILAEYPSISKAVADISPFWKSKYTDDVKDIKIIVNSEE